jgi:HSP20 family protein
MAIRDLIPWNRGRDVTVRRAEAQNPFLTLHREMNRLFDDVFRGFDLAPFGSRTSDQGMFGSGLGWPNIEISETAGEVTITAELPGLGEKDVDVQLAEGVLIIRGEKKSESEDKDRLFSERYYGRFERRIPVDGVDEERVSASFKNGLLTIKLPRTAAQLANVKRITINGK